MRGYIFLSEVLLAAVVAGIAISILSVGYETKTELPFHRVAEDSLAVLKLSGRLHGNNTAQIEEILDNTALHYHLTIYQYDQTPALLGNWTIGEPLESDSTLAKATWVTDDYYYLAVLEVWQ